jgi:hypothetical protein
MRKRMSVEPIMGGLLRAGWCGLEGLSFSGALPKGLDQGRRRGGGAAARPDGGLHGRGHPDRAAARPRRQAARACAGDLQGVTPASDSRRRLDWTCSPGRSGGGMGSAEAQLGGQRRSGTIGSWWPRPSESSMRWSRVGTTRCDDTRFRAVVGLSGPLRQSRIKGNVRASRATAAAFPAPASPKAGPSRLRAPDVAPLRVVVPDGRGHLAARARGGREMQS